MNSRSVSHDDINKGDVIEFYDKGWRFGVVEKVVKKTKRKPKKREFYLVYTERHGKIELDKVHSVYEYKDGKTVPKTLISDLFT